MTPIKQKIRHRQNRSLLPHERERKYVLLNNITVELLIFGVVFTWINVYLRFWLIASVLAIGTFICLFNLILLRKKYSPLLCGHIINIVCLSIMTIGNLALGGISSTSFSWFYVAAILAAATIGLEGFILYSLLSASIVFIFIYYYFTPIYQIPNAYLSMIDDINHIFIFLLVITILYSLLKENRFIKSLLIDQNTILNSEKQKFHYLSNHDALTNLPNRSYFNSYLQEIIESAPEKKNSISLYLMDLDGFKKINDKYGHEVGDILLLQVGKRLQTCFRINDFIARLGGDEFTVVLSYKTNDKIADELMKRIENEFNEPFHIKNFDLKCTISIGMANYPEDASNIEVLLKIADENMQKNKKKKYEVNEKKS